MAPLVLGQGHHPKILIMGSEGFLGHTTHWVISQWPFVILLCPVSLTRASGRVHKTHKSVGKSNIAFI